MSLCSGVCLCVSRVTHARTLAPLGCPRYVHLPTEVWNKHAKGHADTFVVCDGSGEDASCGDSEEHPPFPLDLLRLSPAEHTRYMGFEGGFCAGGPPNLADHRLQQLRYE